MRHGVGDAPRNAWPKGEHAPPVTPQRAWQQVSGAEVALTIIINSGAMHSAPNASAAQLPLGTSEAVCPNEALAGPRPPHCTTQTAPVRHRQDRSPPEVPPEPASPTIQQRAARQATGAQVCLRQTSLRVIKYCLGTGVRCPERVRIGFQWREGHTIWTAQSSLETTEPLGTDILCADFSEAQKLFSEVGLVRCLARVNIVLHWEINTIWMAQV